MNWRIIFGKTILERGRQYYNAGKVKNLVCKDGIYQATVRGSLPYHVEVEMNGNEIRSMKCSCPYAADGHHCKHMAAVLVAIERQIAQTRLKEQLTPAPDPQEREAMLPFPQKIHEDHYSYFDLSRMTKEMHFTKGLCLNARKMADEQKVTLDSVNVGYLDRIDAVSGFPESRPSPIDDSSWISGRENTGIAQGSITVRSASHPISIFFDRKAIRDARCHVPGCGRYYNSSPYYQLYKKDDDAPDLCVHEMALLYLLDDYIKKYNPGDSTDYHGARLIQQFRKSRNIRPAIEEKADTAKSLTLVPRLENTGDGLRVSFRIGADKFYLVKNLTELTDRVRDKGTIEFGSRLKADFAAVSFTEDSQLCYRFIEKVIQDERYRENEMNRYYRSYHLPSVIIKGSINLYGARLDEFFDLFCDRTIEYIDAQTNQKTHVRLQEGTLKLNLRIESMSDGEGAFQGVKVSGSLPQLWEGLQYRYFMEDQCLNRISPKDADDLLPLYHAGTGRQLSFQVGRRHLSEFYYTMLPVLRRHGTVTENNAEEIAAFLPPEVTFRFYLDAEEQNVSCQAMAVYGEQAVSMMDLLKNRFGSVREDFRDINRENTVLTQVLTFFPQTDEEKQLFHCGRDEEVIYEVLEHGVDQLLTLGEVHSTDRFRHLNIRRKTRISIGVSVESDIMNLDISSQDISREELMEILRSYRLKKKFYRLKNGDFLTMEEDSLEALSQLMEDLHLTPKEFVQGKMQLPIYRALYLDQMLGRCESLYSARDSRFRKLVKEFKTVSDSDFEVPDSLQKLMRNYQTIGYKWLRTLDLYGFGGILADDMGLGKTLQMISVLLAHKNEGSKGTSLIVSPASLVFNWQEEFSRYAPELSVCLIVGSQAERAVKIKNYRNYDVLVTSYDLLKRDVADYEDCRFAYQVLDEAQYIKNHSTAASKAVKIIHSRTRFALTGTPIENRLSELWSIFDYLMPGFLYSYETFKKEFETPITRNKDEAATLRLKKMTAPFILRRLKKEVLKDLPDKLEEIRYARLESRQQKLYDAQVIHMQDMLRKQSDENFQKNKLKLLAELTKIRQICCDPALFLENYNGGSAKREACIDLIRSAMEGEHKILVFSQFTSMLELLEQDLTKEGISYYKITGATPKENRTELVQRFNEDATPVFLISLKAGGTGLNLTGADVVIHYDPWWNLAVQNQATDRAHRIGQTKIVSVYKLIVKDSIEEKILRMQESKKNLADEILNGETGGIASLTREELLALIQG